MKKTLAFLMAAMMMLALAACGGATAAPSSSAVSDSSSAVLDDSSAPEGGKVAEIQAAGKLIMLTNAEFPPFEYLGEGAAVKGVDADLAQMIADELGVELEILNADFDTLIDMLNSGKGDLIAAGMSITPERQQQVDFSIPYVDTTLLIIVPVDSDITSAEDLIGKTIAVQEGTTSDLYVSDNVEAKEILRFKSAVEAGTTVSTGKADVAVLDELTAKNVVEANSDTLMLLEEPIAHEQYAMAIAKDGEDLLAVINTVLEKAVADDIVNQKIAEHMELSQG